MGLGEVREVNYYPPRRYPNYKKRNAEYIFKRISITFLLEILTGRQFPYF